jgi:hypothetical protein
LKALHISGSSHLRPAAERVIFCDGGVDASYRDGIDLELSHWIPNRTPASLKADTSTGICFNFIEAGDNEHYDFDLVINNHVDVDGVLSTFVLLHPEFASEHRRVIIETAEIGDFWGWGDSDAQRLYHGLATLMQDLRKAGVDFQNIYRQCYELTLSMLSGHQPDDDEGQAALDVLAESVARIKVGTIARTLINPRLVHYAIPRLLASADIAAALTIPPFNTPFAANALLLPNVRACFDRERVALVSIETAGGWYYDLWYPGYCWADTPTLWRPPGLYHTGSSNTHRLASAGLSVAVIDLQELETAAGRWTLAGEFSPFASIGGRNFPVVLSFLQAGRPVPSALPPATVTAILATAS